MGLFFFAALHAILVPMYFLAPKRDKAGQLLPEHPSVWDERDCDRQRELLGAGASPNERNQGRTALMNAAREGSVPCVENLLKAGARLEEVDDNGNTALAEAVMAGRDDTAAVLVKAGAKDFRVTEGPGHFQVTNDSEPYGVVKEYLAAVKAGDFATMARLVPGASTKSMNENSENLALWQSMRPAEPDLVNGWMDDDAATITVRGRSSDGEKLVTYHLQKTLEGWRIYHEWFPAER
jgi:ankyrin repeat protein